MTQKISTIRVSCVARPARIAFLLGKPDHAQLREVLKINTTLWGGMFNPIVILDGSDKRHLGRHAEYADSHEKRTLALLRDFDPDVLIRYTDVLPDYLNAFGHRCFGPEKLRWNPWGHGEVSFFLQVWPFLHEFWKEAYRGNPNGLPVRYIDYEACPTGETTFLMARFGGFTDPANEQSTLREYFEATPIVYEENFRKNFKVGELHLPMGLTTYGLDVASPGFDNFKFFALDTNDVFDLVDYWNLRAAGLWVFPLPTKSYTDFAVGAKEFADRATYPINPHVMNYPTVVKADSVSDESLDEIADWVAGLGVKGLSRQGWVPKHGERGYRVAPELEVKEVEGVRDSTEAIFTDGFGSVRVPVPKCEFAGAASSQHWCVSLKVFTGHDEQLCYRLPWLRRECDEAADYGVNQSFEVTASRVSKRGIVAWQRGSDADVSFFPLSVDRVGRAFLKSCGIEFSRFSSPGLATQRAIDQLGGLFLSGTLQQRGVREILEQLSHGRSMLADDVRRTMWKSAAPSDERKKAVPNILDNLFEKRVLRIGIKFKCARCERYDWYHVSEFDEQFRCKWCFEGQPVPRLDDKKWEYKSDGLFRLENKMQGALSTILALRFLYSYLDHSNFHYLPSFEYSVEGTNAEADFLVFSTDFFQVDVDVIIGEAKSGLSLRDVDKERMQILAAKTGAIVAFCTLNPDFSTTDKEYFCSLIEKGHRAILITGPVLDMDYMAIMKYRRTHSAPVSKAEALYRGSVTEVLGKEFALKHNIWI